MKLTYAFVLLAACTESTPQLPIPPAEIAKPPQMAPPTIKQPQSGFAGFAKDGKRFAWVAESSYGGEIHFLKIIGASEDTPKQESVFPDAAAQAELKKKLEDFSPVRTQAPDGFRLEGDLTATPPTLALVTAKGRTPVNVGKYPYPPTDGAEVWGLSADQKMAAVHIGGKDVPGVITNGKGKDFHFFFVVAVP